MYGRDGVSDYGRQLLLKMVDYRQLLLLARYR